MASHKNNCVVLSDTHEGLLGNLARGLVHIIDETLREIQRIGFFQALNAEETKARYKAGVEFLNDLFHGSMGSSKRNSFGRAGISGDEYKELQFHLN
mmetsp:Transcript_23345/g.30274  ORF Transcript_23345/g.30274 Transcript_23345/m.30274 type:complete len:97 (+) Transcript_23345:529-819(+)